MEIGCLFLIYKWSYSYPLIRMIVACLILLGSMFMMRTHKLGLVFFALAIVAIYGQTFPGMVDYPEVVVRLTLWCIVVGLYPTLLMVLLGVLWFPLRAGKQMQEALCARLDDALGHLATPAAPLAEKYVEMLGIRKFLDLALDSSLEERESLLSMCGCADGEEKCAVPEIRV